MKFNRFKWPLLLLFFALGASAAMSQTLKEKTGLRFYEHHSPTPNPDPTPGSQNSVLGLKSAYDFTTHQFIDISGTYDGNIVDMMATNGQVGNPGIWGFTSGESNIWYEMGNGTTKYSLAPSGFDYANATAETIKNAFDASSAEVEVGSITGDALYIAKLRGEEKYIAIRIYNATNVDYEPTTGDLIDQYFDFDYKYVEEGVGQGTLLEEKTGITIYEHHIYTENGNFTDLGVKSGYDLLNHQYVSSVDPKMDYSQQISPTNGPYQTDVEVANIDMVEHNGPASDKKTVFGFTSGASSIWSGYIRGNNATQYVRVSPSKGYADFTTVEEAQTAFLEGIPSKSIDDVATGDVYIAHIRGAYFYAVISIVAANKIATDVDLYPQQGDNYSFQFDYKYGQGSEPPAILVESIAIQSASGTVEVAEGGSLTIQVSGVEPSNASDKTVTFSVENGTGSGSIDAQTGVFSATKAGAVTIVASANDASGVSGRLDVTVTPYLAQEVTGVRIWDPQSPTVDPNPNAFGDEGSNSGYSFYSHRIVDVSNMWQQNSNADMIVHNGPWALDLNGDPLPGDPKIGFTSDQSNVLGKGNAASVYCLAPSWFDYSSATEADIVAAFNANSAGTTVDSIYPGQVIIAKIRDLNYFAAIKITTCYPTVLPSNVSPEDVYFEFDYKYTRNEFPFVCATSNAATTESATNTVDAGSTLQCSVGGIVPDKVSNANYTWTVENGTGQASIDENGLLSAIVAGSVTVKAQANDGCSPEADVSVTINKVIAQELQEVTDIQIFEHHSQSLATDQNVFRQSGYSFVDHAYKGSIDPNTFETPDWTGDIDMVEYNGPYTPLVDKFGFTSTFSTVWDGDVVGNHNTKYVKVSPGYSYGDFTTEAEIKVAYQSGVPVFSVDDAEPGAVYAAYVRNQFYLVLKITGVSHGPADHDVGDEYWFKFDYKYGTGISNQSVLVKSIEIGTKDNVVEIGVDESLQLSATVEPSDALDKTLSWYVIPGLETYASIDENNVLSPSPLADDKNLVVYAVANDGSAVLDTVHITVAKSANSVPVEKIVISGKGNTSSISEKGGELQVEVTTLEPDGATNKGVVWSISDGEAFAEISAGGLLSAKSNGAVTVRATASDGSGVYGEAAITISGQVFDPVLVEKIVISGNNNVSSISEKGGTLQVEVTSLEPDNATDKSIMWSISQGKGLAEISPNGLLSAKLNGIVVVRATAADRSGVFNEVAIAISGQSSSSVLVDQISVAGANNASSISEKGGTLQIEVTSLEPDNATDKSVVWSVSEGRAFADISEEGLLSAKSNGTVVVRATSVDGSNVYGEVTVTISGQYKKIPEDMEIISTTGSFDLTLDGELQLDIVITPEDAGVGMNDIEWKIVDATGSATVSDGGLVSPVAVGYVYVVAQWKEDSKVRAIAGISIGQATGVVALESGISLFPLPTSDWLCISAPESVLVVEIFDMAGNKKLQEEGAGCSTLDVSALSPGIYSVLITFSDATVIQKQFVKN